jgi:hypothetical protein
MGLSRARFTSGIAIGASILALAAASCGNSVTLSAEGSGGGSSSTASSTGEGGCGDTTTDPNNCGACGHVCAPGYPCMQGACGPIAPVGDGGVAGGSCPAGTSSPPAACPAVCNGGCTSDLCILDCNESTDCQNAAIVCPEGMRCKIECGGVASCQGATLTCPSSSACEIQCAHAEACMSASIRCPADAPCSLTCGEGLSTCQSVQLQCGQGACDSQCDGPYAVPANVSCGGSCACATTCLGAEP